MLSLILFRHGKSDWSAPYSEDCDRPVSERGVLASKKMGRWLAGLDFTPDRILCSKADRCKETLKLAIHAGRWDSSIEYLDEMYEAEASVTMNLMKLHGQNAERLMLVGHEPCLSNIISLLIGGGSFVFPTAAVAILETTETDWSQVKEGCFQLKILQTPKFVFEEQAN
jgi:phosphohistidine phosphatase